MFNIFVEILLNLLCCRTTLLPTNLNNHFTKTLYSPGDSADTGASVSRTDAEPTAGPTQRPHISGADTEQVSIPP